MPKMISREYAERCAKEMGWQISYAETNGGGGGENVYEKDGVGICNSDTFDPSSDWESAGVWISYLLSKDIGIRIYQVNPVCSPSYYRCCIDINTCQDGTGDTPLLALQAASEAYFASKDK